MPIIHHLIVDQFGAFVGKHSGRLRVTHQKDGKAEMLAEAPILHLEQVLITGNGVSLSSDAVLACCEEGIPIYFLSSSGRPYAALYSSGLTGTVQTRRAQLMAYDDTRSLTLARAFASGKIENQAAFLRYVAKYRKETAPDLYRELCRTADEMRANLADLDHLEGTTVDEVRSQVLAIEGRAAQAYWAALQRTVSAEYNWPGRLGRGAKDPVNSALNYGYGILYGQIERAIVLAGLDPYAGFIHVDRPGKPSLVLDLIEEFRVAAVDRVVFGLVGKGVNFEQDEQGLLKEDTRRMLAENVLERLEKPEKYQGKRHLLRAIIQMQARHLATFVRGDRPAYQPFIVKW
ncbi:MAG: CRISPR-associated endonuclease Cas1 [Anaerolineae bacterium]|jgi:CRISPR-associated protein Cas1|nr:CRISPR-associated endonuclease Cas1 [Anaerolineae bacterium]